MKTNENGTAVQPHKYNYRILSPAIVLLGMGLSWVAVVFYRLHARGISPELWSVLIAGLGTGFGFALLYAAFQRNKSIVPSLIMGAVASALLVAALLAIR